MIEEKILTLGSAGRGSGARRGVAVLTACVCGGWGGTGFEWGVWREKGVLLEMCGKVFFLLVFSGEGFASYMHVREEGS